MLSRLAYTPLVSKNDFDPACLADLGGIRLSQRMIHRLRLVWSSDLRQALWVVHAKKAHWARPRTAWPCLGRFNRKVWWKAPRCPDTIFHRWTHPTACDLCASQWMPK